MKEPWDICGLCSATGFMSWPHRTNHFKKHHPTFDHKIDYSNITLTEDDVLQAFDAQDAAWEAASNG